MLTKLNVSIKIMSVNIVFDNWCWRLCAHPTARNWDHCGEWFAHADGWSPLQRSLVVGVRAAVEGWHVRGITNSIECVVPLRIGCVVPIHIDLDTQSPSSAPSDRSEWSRYRHADPRAVDIL